eukprot:CAMPEP_0119016970 /NCGR_PEP_ID=MMETSP1176-20130426/14927_1 /TAXON_ID=265551 /ORGANISM="Synedropsis recta cf, Strain CCMP1620" /LENGTH=654 /DNA_ID=CAMNT_0006970549 /DNA_START=38 /DNA_END=2002 /DNA_ORIENTATION=-
MLTRKPAPPAAVPSAGLFARASLLSTLVVMLLSRRTHYYDLTTTFLLASSVVVVVFLIIARATSEIPIQEKPQTKLGSPEYDITPLKAPTVSGNALLLLSKIIGNAMLGHIVARPLVNKNGSDQIRDLARQATERGSPMVSMPFCRVSSDTVTDAMAATATNAIEKGISRSYKAGEVNGVLEYNDAYKSGAVTPSQMMHRVLEAIDELKFMNMFVACHREDVLEQARASDKRWKENKPLSIFDGVPIAVKDMIKVKGYKCSDGMVLHDSDPVSTQDDTMVSRFREAGAIILGTTVMTEYGRCPLGYNSHYKGPFNPYDSNCYSGGSSSGSVCSVMTGLVPIAISFDGGGSIRLPAAFSGAFGLATTFGRIPFDCHIGRTSGNVHAGTNTATVTDTALAYSLLAQNEPGHILSKLYDGDIKGPPRPHLSDFDKIEDFSDLRIGIFWDYFNDSDPEIAAHCKAVVNELQKRGAKVVEVTIPHLKALSMAHGFSLSTAFSSLEETHFYHRNDLEPATRIQLQVGKTITGVEYMAANRMRGWAIDYIKKLFAEQIDIFLTPGCPIVAPQIPKAALSCGESNLPLFSEVMRYIFLVNLAGFAGMTMPITYTQAEDPLPISLHVMCDHWNDALLLRIAHFVEKSVLERKQPKHFVKISLE